MSKVTLTPLANLTNETSAVTAINANNAVISNAFDNTLSLDGTQPNQMKAQLDMNSNRVLNLPSAVDLQEPVTLGVFNSAVIGKGNVPVGGSVGQVLTKNSSTDYDSKWASTSSAFAAGSNITLTGSAPTTIATVTNPTFTNVTTPFLINTGTLTLPTSSDTLVGRATTDTLTNKTFDTAGAGNSFKIAGTAITANTGTGNNVLATSPTLVTPVLGAATATSINKVAVTAPATSATLTLADTSTLITAGTGFSTTLTSTGATNSTLPSGTHTLVGQDTTDTLTNKTLTSPTLTSPVMTTPTLGAATATTINGNAITAGTGTLTLGSGTLNTGVGGTLTGSSSAAIYYDNIPQNSQTAAYQLVLSDAQKCIFHPSSDNSIRTYTIPANASVAFPIGTVVTFVNLINVVTIAITTDTMILAGVGSTGSRTLAVNGIATAMKVASTTWIISGTGLT